MSATAAADTRAFDSRVAPRLLRAWLRCAVLDWTWAVVLTLIYGRSIVRLWQGVASVPFGASMMTGGAPTMLLGIALHFCVALFWSTVFLALYTTSSWLRRATESRAGILTVALFYGPMIWIVMSMLVIPTFLHRPATINVRWWIELAGHVVAVGTPIVWSIARPPRG